MRLILFSFFIASLALAGEVSVFGAGDLESSNPYGLTTSEKAILKNKKTLTKFDRKVDDARSNIDMLNERIDGLESAFEGDSQKLNKTVIKLDDTILKLKALTEQTKVDKEQSLQDIKNITEQLKVTSEEIKSNFKVSFDENFKNLKKLEDTILKLTTRLNEINADYISQNELKENMSQFITKDQYNEMMVKFNKLVTFVNKQAKQVEKEREKKKKDKFSKPKKELLADAKKLFRKNYFTKAIPIFEYLIKNNYRPAESNFYLGEIWFYRKKYKTAIHHFKTSMMLYDKAKYIPKLLLHSAISFEKTNDLENAANFYGTLIDVYPETKEAKEAQKNLTNIN